MAPTALVTEIDDSLEDKLSGGGDPDLFYDGVGDKLKGVKKDNFVLL